MTGFPRSRNGPVSRCFDLARTGADAPPGWLPWESWSTPFGTGEDLEMSRRAMTPSLAVNACCGNRGERSRVATGSLGAVDGVPRAPKRNPSGRLTAESQKRLTVQPAVQNTSRRDLPAIRSPIGVTADSRRTLCVGILLQLPPSSSVDGSKPAISGHRKTGHFRRPRRALIFTSWAPVFASSSGAWCASSAART